MTNDKPEDENGNTFEGFSPLENVYVHRLLQIIEDKTPSHPKCEGCPLAEQPQACFQMMYHSDNHCQKYLRPTSN